MNNKEEETTSRVNTLAALIMGYVLTYPFNSYVQNALGNWFMLLGQVLETNATFLQLYQSNSSNNNQNNNGNMKHELDLEQIKEAINIMKKEIDELIEANKKEQG